MSAITTLINVESELTEKIKALKSNGEIKPGTILELRLEFLEFDLARCQHLIIEAKREQEQWDNKLLPITETECGPGAEFRPIVS